MTDLPHDDDGTDARLARRLSRWLTIDPAQVTSFRGYCRPCRFAAGDPLFRLDAPADDAVLLESGVVRAFYLLDHREVNRRLLGAPAAALPYHSYLQRTPADEAIEALTPVEGIRIRFRDYCRERPGLLAEQLQRRLAETHFIALQRRLRMLQGRSAAQRYAYYRATMEADVVPFTPG